jgi:uncharacterized integral membrane protein (TIGR00697 family)
MNRPFRAFLLVASAYIAAQMLADIASLRIISLAGFAVDAGTLVYPFTFTLRDLVHKMAGKSAARTLIFAAALINLAMAGLFWLVSVLPADLATGPQTTFGEVLAPVWRIVLASIVAEVLSELVDTEVYQRWVDRFERRLQWGRVLVSNAVAIPLDSALFVTIAFGGVLSSAVVWQIFWLNLAIKGTVTLISIPWIYLVKPEPLDRAHETPSRVG